MAVTRRSALLGTVASAALSSEAAAKNSNSVLQSATIAGPMPSYSDLLDELRTTGTWSLDFSMSFNASEATSVGGLSQFSAFQVERLLSEVMMLLNRSLQDRYVCDDYASRAFELRVELDRAVRLKELLDQEASEGPGLYDWSSKEAKQEQQAATAISEGAGEYQTKLEKYRDFIRNEAPSLELVARRSANLALLPIYNDVSEAKTWWWPPTDPAAKSAYPNGEYPEQFVGSQQRIFPNIASELAAGKQVRYSSSVQEFQIEAELISAKAASDAAQARLRAAEIRGEWEELNRQFSRRYDEIVYSSQISRTQEATKKAGKLNYIEKAQAIAERYRRDMQDALARMKAASRGLTEIFGFNSVLPGQSLATDLFPTPGQPSTRQFHEQCILWARDAASFLSRFSQYDQGWVQVLSVRSMLGDVGWTSGLEQRFWKVMLSREVVQESWGEKMYHVRLKGLSAFVVHDDPTIVWRVKAKLPDLGVFDLLPDLDARRALDQGELGEQGKLAPVRFGRVQSRRSPVPPDVVGTSSALNASPFGEWQLWLGPAIQGRSNIPEVEDIQLDLHLAYRPQPPQS